MAVHSAESVRILDLSATGVLLQSQGAHDFEANGRTAISDATHALRSP